MIEIIFWAIESTTNIVPALIIRQSVRAARLLLRFSVSSLTFVEL